MDRNIALSLDIQFHVVNCGECGGTYAINARYQRQKKEEGGFWHCPYCETGWGYAESELKKLKKQLEAEKKRTQWAARARERAEEEAAHQAARARGFKGAMVKTKKRVGRGVCPSCNRSFENLRRHMETKHPEYADEDPEERPSHYHCGAETATGEPCTREVSAPGATCWQHP